MNLFTKVNVMLMSPIVISKSERSENTVGFAYRAAIPFPKFLEFLAPSCLPCFQTRLTLILDLDLETKFNLFDINTDSK